MSKAPFQGSPQDRADYIQKRLHVLYPSPPIPLDHKDAFTLLVAVVLSARNTDKKVNQVTPRLFGELGDTPKALSQADTADIQAIIKPCGLSETKAKAIKELSTILFKQHNSTVPCDAKQLEALPGVGEKTAAVVLSQAFNIPAFPVDTHIFRLAHRWGLSEGKTPSKVSADLKKLFPAKQWNPLHLQMIYYGREHCPARGCDGTQCEICRHCRGLTQKS